MKLIESIKLADTLNDAASTLAARGKLTSIRELLHVAGEDNRCFAELSRGDTRFETEETGNSFSGPNQAIRERSSVQYLVFGQARAELTGAVKSASEPECAVIVDGTVEYDHNRHAIFGVAARPADPKEIDRLLNIKVKTNAL